MQAPPKEILFHDMHICVDVYNRLSRAIRKNEDFEYTLTEAELV
jgi:hypothetical protein